MKHCSVDNHMDVRLNVEKDVEPMSYCDEIGFHIRYICIVFRIYEPEINIYNEMACSNVSLNRNTNKGVENRMQFLYLPAYVH